MKGTLAILGVALMAPVLLLVAVALGPVVLGILCAVGFGLIVFVVVNLVMGLGLLVEKTGAWFAHHSRVPRLHT